MKKIALKKKNQDLIEFYKKLLAIKPEIKQYAL